MFNVQFRDAANRDRVLVKQIFLPFDPSDQKLVRLRQRAYQAKHDTYRVVDHDYEIVVEDPGESEIIIYLTPAD